MHIADLSSSKDVETATADGEEAYEEYTYEVEESGSGTSPIWGDTNDDDDYVDSYGN